jgi:response regulator RpfG family c-di-GMP phosphodiesterase
MNPDKSIRISEEKYKIAGRKGKIYISDKDSLHYNTANISAKLYLLLGVEADESTIKSSVYERAFIPLMLTTLFVILVILLAYQNISRFRELIKSQKIIIHSLANTTEWRDKTTGRHLQATKEYVFVLASRMRKNRKFKKTITKDFLNDIVDASPLHDIGKVGIEDSVLLKPGKLNEEEYNIIKNHVYIGKKLLQNDIDQFTTKQTFFSPFIPIYPFPLYFSW